MNQKLKHKENIKTFDKYSLRVIFFDPTPIYQKIKVDFYKRNQSIPIEDMFPKNGNVCGCGCGKELSGRQRRWATKDCISFAQAVWGIINGYSETITKYLRLYHGNFACFNCGLTDYYKEQKNGVCVNGIHKDHIVPVHKGGGGCWLSNYQLLCDKCHKEKTKTDLLK